MNTKHIIRYAAATVAAIATLACSKDDAANPGTPENPDTTPFTITATIDDGSDTRISMDDDGVNKIVLKWKTGDPILVVNDENGGTPNTFIAQSVSADGKTAAFEFLGNYTGTPAYAAHSGPLTVISFTPKNISTPTAYYHKNLDDVPKSFHLYARYDAESRKLVFKPLYALLKLIVTLPQQAQGDLGTLNLTCSDGSAIFYQSFHDVTQDPFVRSGRYYAVNKLSCYLNGTGSIVAGETTSLYIPIYTGSEPDGKTIVITLSVGGTDYTATIKGGKLEAGKCYPLTLTASKWTQVVQ